MSTADVPSTLRDRLVRGLGTVPWRPLVASFVAARVVVLLALAASRLVPGPVIRTDLLGWDAAWYLDIAEHGYRAVAVEGRRFFPVVPVLARALGLPLGGDLGVALLVQSNVAAFGYALLAHRLCLAAGLPRSVADRVPWVVAFAPAGFVLVMGYSEALFGVLVCVVLWCARRGVWWPVVLAGVVAGAMRPTGVVLVLPVLIEACRGLRVCGGGERLWRLSAVAAPAVGLGSYLGWSWRVFGDPFQPLTAQTVAGLRGGVAVNPLATVVHGVRSLFSGDIREAAPLVHLIWVVLAVTVLVAARRVLPVSWWAFAAATVVLGLTARNFNSFERYAASAVPLLIAVAWLLEQQRARTAVRVLAPVVLFGYSLTTFLHAYIP